MCGCPEKLQNACWLDVFGKGTKYFPGKILVCAEAAIIDSIRAQIFAPDFGFNHNIDHLDDHQKDHHKDNHKDHHKDHHICAPHLIHIC